MAMATVTVAGGRDLGNTASSRRVVQVLPTGAPSLRYRPRPEEVNNMAAASKGSGKGAGSGKSPAPTVSISAKTGRFVTKGYADKHPATTVTEKKK